VKELSVANRRFRGELLRSDPTILNSRLPTVGSPTRLASMRVRVLYFASFREAAGRDEEERELPDGADVAALWRQLAAEVPLFAQLPRPAPAAVNREHSPATTVLRAGDEVAFLPPVAGG